ncbi:MAG: putative sugar nucleotidyl transferase [Candidatus Margulisiibacteriota bacterium]|nr:putative sugar nucleotidyl transferase [Candidatus Margulisiibacteriota bacterium]
MNIIIYEDEGYKKFLPLTWTRPVYNLRCGISTLAEKIIRHYPKNKAEHSCRYYLPGNKLMKFEKGLFINGRVLMDARLAKEITVKGQDQVFVAGDEIIAIRAVSGTFDQVRKKAKIKKIRVKVAKNLWDLIRENGEQVKEDWNYLRKKKRNKIKIDKSVVFYNRGQVFIDEGVTIEANSVVDARGGPIFIGKGTIVKPLTYLKGPLSIGPDCRVGGEVGESIFHGRVNKQHYGFIGHSYVGEWVNLGAGTTNSDLKNNYNPVKMLVNGKRVDTGEKFVGCFIGDHAKTGIGTLITTGATIGVAANVFGGGVTPKATPSFSWGNKYIHNIQRAVETAIAVMWRRGIKMTDADSDLLKQVFKLTAGERKRN